MARHAVVDVAQVLRRPPKPAAIDRLPPIAARVLEQIAVTNGALAGAALDNLARLRAMYEPYVVPLAEHLLMPLPAWAGEPGSDNWRTSAWERGTGIRVSGRRDVHDDD